MLQRSIKPQQLRGPGTVRTDRLIVAGLKIALLNKAALIQPTAPAAPVRAHLLKGIRPVLRPV